MFIYPVVACILGEDVVFFSQPIRTTDGLALFSQVVKIARCEVWEGACDTLGMPLEPV